MNCPVVVNTDAYEALPDAHRAALDESVDEAIAHYLENYAGLLERWEGILAEKNVTKVVVPDSEIAKFKEVAMPIHQEWIDTMSAQGLPAQELYDLVNSTLEKQRMN